MNGGIWVFVVALGLSAAEESDIWREWVPQSELNLFPTLPIAAPFSEDENCREESRRLILNLKNKTLWAMQMWDSSATTTFGALHGNKYHFGNYDECLAVTKPVRAHYCEAKIRAFVHTKEAFEGDFYELSPDPNATVWRKFQNSRRDRTQYARDESQWGLCVPLSCNSTEMENAINHYLSKLNERSLATNGTTYEVEIPENYCFDGSEEEFSYGEMGFWVFTWLLLIVIGVATSLDLGMKKELVIEESKFKGYLMKFSLKRNVLALMERDEGGREKETHILYGIRFYNVCYIVTDHRMGILLSTVIFNSQKFEEDFRSWLNIILPHGDLLVDTYFFIGGYLATLNLFDIYKARFYNPDFLEFRLGKGRCYSQPNKITLTVSWTEGSYWRALPSFTCQTVYTDSDGVEVDRPNIHGAPIGAATETVSEFQYFPEWTSVKLLMSFSIKRNLKLIMHSDDIPETNHLKFLHGIRCVSIVLIVLDHHVAIFLTAAMYNRQAVEEALRSHQNLFLPHGDLLVDTFFYISGFLVTYMLLTTFQKRQFNLLFAVLHRFLRLAPLYFYIVWFQASVLLRFGSGPAWKIGLNDEVEFCRKNWWANLLFIQNYVKPKEMCMLHAWYLPCDMHFFILAVFLIMLIRRNKAVGSWVLYILTVIAVLIPGVVTYIHELQPILTFNPKFVDKPRLDPSFEYLYVKSHTRAAVYLLGMLTAYHLFERRNSNWKISKQISVLTCFLGLGLLFAPMVYGSLYYNPRKKYNLAESVAFSILRRFSWGLGWVLFMVVNRFGVIPIFGKVFTWKISVPLSKTTYAVYLIHFLIQMADEAKAKIPYQFISFEMFVKGTNDLVFATGYALVLYLIIELPFRLIFKELLFPAAKKKRPPLPDSNQISVKADPPQVFSIKL